MTRPYVSIVSGLPRSGTSMMMRMLEAGGIPALVDNIRKADEDNPLGYYEFEPVKQTKKDASWLRDAVGKVVKMVHVLLLDLPLDREYRVVFMRREMAEVLKSQDVMLERHGKKKSEDLKPDDLTRIFLAQVAKVQDHLKNNSCFRVIEVKYNDVMSNPLPQVEAINRFFDGTLDVQAMARVVDPSLYRQRT
ncbi:MAG: sulfotransferase family protein [Phycisphaerae bacterium]|nr:sulfotransferase family protein [Phycisphaerae bacterium]